MIISEDDYLKNYYLYLVRGKQILEYHKLINSQLGTEVQELKKEILKKANINSIIESGEYSKEEIEELLQLPYSEVEKTIFNRLKEKYGEKVFYNRCPKCNQLARTPKAQQCPNCYCDWH